MTSFIQFVYLFFLLVLSAILGILMYNIYTKSFRPRAALVFFGFLLCAFVVSGIVGIYSIPALVRALDIDSFTTPLFQNKSSENTEFNF